MFPQIYNDAIAILLVRTIAGILFFFQGYDKIFNVKIPNVVNTFSEPLSKFHLPLSILTPLIALSSFLELTCGLLLLVGLFQNIVLYIIAANLIFVAFIFSSVKAMWDMKFFFPRLILIFILLIAGPANDYFSLDSFIRIYLN